MNNLIDLNSIFHRSKNRILELGEVFTPEQFVEDMLNLVSKGKRNFWANEEICFFEPTCGHGNIVLPIFRRRLDAFYKKAESQDIKNPHLFAIANAINTLWAMDIDSKNIEHCRYRLLQMALEFIKLKTSISSDQIVVQCNQKFFTHFLCALLWQVQENEMISSITNANRAYTTKIGGNWLEKNGHKPVNFELTWTTYYRDCEARGVSALSFERCQKFVSALLAGNARGYSEFEFARFIMPSRSSVNGPDTNSLAVGV